MCYIQQSAINAGDIAARLEPHGMWKCVNSVDRYQRFGEIYFVLLQGTRNIFLEMFVPTVRAKLHCIAFQNALTVTIIALTKTDLILSLYRLGYQGLSIPVNKNCLL